MKIKQVIYKMGS